MINLFLCNAFFNIRDFDNAIKHGLQALKFDIKDMAIITLIGRAFFHKGDKPTAMIYWNEVYKLSESNAEYLKFIGSDLVSSKFYTDGDRFFKRSLKINPNCEVTLMFKRQALMIALNPNMSSIAYN
mgnify:FL=1